MKSRVKKHKTTWLPGLFFILILFKSSSAAIKISEFIDTFENNDKQSVLAGSIDSLIIERGPARYEMRSGDLTLADCGWGSSVAMAFRGRVKFTYQPPDGIECYQLHKFTGQDTLSCEFDDITFFWTVPPQELPDSSLLSRQPIDKQAWKNIRQAQKDAIDYLGIYLPNALIGDLVSAAQDTFLYADFTIKKFEHLVFRENPLKDDCYALYKLRQTSGYKTDDVYGAYSPDDSPLVSGRGLLPINITHYDINVFIENNFDLQVECRVHFVPLRDDRKYIHFDWYYDTDPISIIDADNNSLHWIKHKDENGLGVVLNRPMVVGDTTFIDFTYECKGLENLWGVFFVKSLYSWYPANGYNDKATFDVRFSCGEDYEVVACGKLLETNKANGRTVTKWKLDYPAPIYSFNIGIFDKSVRSNEGLPTVTTFISKNIPHKDLAMLFAALGELSNANMADQVGIDICNSLEYFSYLFGPCPFDEIRATEIPWSFGQGSPGQIYLSWLTFQFGDMAGSQAQFRAHEVSHQWWGHIVDSESYRDYWIIEGLAEYSGFIYFQALCHDPKLWESILDDWRRYIGSGSGGGSMGTKAGPVTLGYRLNSSKSDDYQAVCYAKAAYIFHMLRYLMHDYNNDSDDRFIGFLRDLLDKYGDTPITTEGLRSLLEEDTQTDLGWFFDQWVYGIEMPTYDFSYKSSKTPEGKYQVVCHVKQHDVPDGFMMIVPLKVIFENGQFAQLKTWVDQPDQDITLPLLPLEPKKIEFNTCGAVLCQVNYK